MYGKIKAIVSEFVTEHDLATKAKMDPSFLTDMLTVRLFDGLNQKEASAPRPPRSNGSGNKGNNQQQATPGQTSILDNIKTGSEVAK